MTETNRPNKIKSKYDLIIVGGGIYGAALLWEATLQGLSAILVEKGDFGCATSANSLKIIHGGIRYLQQMDFKRMKESIKERKILMKIAPHLVHPLPCIVPTFGKLKESKAIYRAAFLLNDIIGYDRNSGSASDKTIPPCSIISSQEFKKLIPGPEEHPFTGGAKWFDASVHNSERLVLAFIFGACQRGAEAFNYMPMTKLVVDNNNVIGINALDLLSNEPVEIKGTITINNTGPWVNDLLKLNLPTPPRSLYKCIKAVNLIVPRKISNHAFGLKAPTDIEKQKKRLLFFVPWRQKTVIGTWYFPTDESPDNNCPTGPEIATCIKDVQRTYPALDVSVDDISFIHSGMLPGEFDSDNKSDYSLNRHYTIIDHGSKGGPCGIITVLGVKYTTARDVATKTMGLISQHMKISNKVRLSENTPLYGGDIFHYKSFLAQAIDQCPSILNHDNIKHMVSHYGSNYKTILQLTETDPDLAQPVPGAEEIVKAEILYSIREELTFSLSDLLLRRTDIGSAGKPADETVIFCADLMAAELGWNTEKKNAEIKSFLHTYTWPKAI